MGVVEKHVNDHLYLNFFLENHLSRCQTRHIGAVPSNTIGFPSIAITTSTSNPQILHLIWRGGQAEVFSQVFTFTK